MAVMATLYVVSDEPSPVLSGLLGVGFSGGVLMAVASPTRWSASTTVRLYQAVPLLFAGMMIVSGGYYLLTTELWLSPAVPVGWGVLAFIGFGLVDWTEVEGRIEELQAVGATGGDTWPPLPRRQFIQLQYATFGALTAGMAVVLGDVLYRPDVGVFAALAGVGGAGLLNVWCSPYSGPPNRVVRLRKARWAVLAVGLGASGLYGWTVSNRPALAATFAIGTVALVFWALVIVNWGEMHRAVTEAQADSERYHSLDSSTAHQ